ncbi:glycoside hydrolase family 43 protein [Dothidotthia symphoricarpi CBS 119687]|uniref:Arabinan endo-1,5-alpha-L-arabinosidase n=1 Tax=Dothidotthia symphoricarpi CBS 119687 TaxID=1392245 RepID=A0A6A6AA81_9PLEO|nr:glycoside hydrolase family 43 protein [Dothidotthia symphoricarpi CBS 119687]KAF2127757.1 glycoside hydrolase family 43 protein [Dothidotthia symphoricarpi CBS 119687]
MISALQSLKYPNILSFAMAILLSVSITIASFLPLLVLGSPVPVPQAYTPEPYSYPEPEPCHGNCSWVHDPSIFYEDGVYWRFVTSGNIGVSVAQSLNGPWEYRGALLHEGTKIQLRDDQDIWAPSISKRDDTYYAHYSVSFFGSQNSEIGVASSTSLKPGTWTDHGSMQLPLSTAYNLIDPYVFRDGEDSDAPTYFTWGSYWSGIQQIELAHHSELLAWAGNEADIVNIISNTTSSPSVVEGAIQWKKDKWYYIFFSVGQCCRTEKELALPGDEYHVVVCRSNAATGPYFDRNAKDCTKDNGGTTILASHGDIYAPGGQGILVHPDNGKTVMYYHYGKVNSGQL